MIMCASQIVWAHENEAGVEAEMFIETEGAGSSETIKYTITAQGTYWDADYEISSDAELGGSDISITGNNVGMNTKGWSFIRNVSGSLQEFGFALYKFETDHSSEYFYIDFRDCRYVDGEGTWDADVLIRYDAATETFKWCNNNPAPCSLTTITDGSTINIWEMKGESSQEFDCFEGPTNPTNLTITNSGGHPELTWESSVPREHSKYLVYRNGSSITPSAITDTSYLDENVSMGSGASIPYKVRAVLSNILIYSPGYSNTESIEGRYIDKLAVGSAPSGDSFALLPAWPNPFNPTTTIEFVLPRSGFVTLKVYSVLGEEVATLVNGEVSAGLHIVQFDAFRLSSGVYTYRLRAGDFVETRKMILHK
jgi:hypothetical protein